MSERPSRYLESSRQIVREQIEQIIRECVAKAASELVDKWMESNMQATRDVVRDSQGWKR